MSNMDLSKCAPEYREKIFVQHYDVSPTIEGVRIVEPKVFHEDGGFFLEVQRLLGDTLQDIPEVTLRQVNYSSMEPGVVKAWHVHPRQHEAWFVAPTERFLVALVDIRDGSSTKGNIVRKVLGAGRAHLLSIPPGVAHGLTNIDRVPHHLLYFVSEHFNPNPDESEEYRLPWDAFGREVWEVANG